MIDLYSQTRCGSDHSHDHCVPLSPERGKGYFRSVSPRQGMLLFLEKYQLDRTLTVETANMQIPLGFSFCISGQVQWSIAGVRKPFLTEGGQCEVLLSDRWEGQAHYDTGQPVEMVNIMLSPRLLESYLGSGERSLPGLRAVNKPIVYRKSRLPASVRNIVKQLLHAPLNGAADALRMQAKVMELVAFQLGLLDEPAAVAGAMPCQPAEADLVRRAQTFLAERMQSPPTIPQLARWLGTNETKLKRAFVAYCGQTVYGYLTERRMQKASDLLVDGHLSMAEIGAQIGFSERTHFSRAFARYYGMPPSVYRRNVMGARS